MNDLTRLPPPALPVSTPIGADERRLTAAQFQQLAQVPAAAEWLAKIDYQPHSARDR